MPPESSGYIQVPGNPVLSSQAAAYYKANVEKVIQFSATSKLFKSSRDRRTALSIYRKARQTYAQIEKRAPLVLAPVNRLFVRDFFAFCAEL